IIKPLFKKASGIVPSGKQKDHFSLIFSQSLRKIQKREKRRGEVENLNEIFMPIVRDYAFKQHLFDSKKSLSVGKLFHKISITTL
ncbi:MAG TPA: hypothetical protein VLJ41_17515, partial [Segetibacter sp.]|nr:hypothetical protein [Segetibacter sp.]